MQPKTKTRSHRFALAFPFDELRTGFDTALSRLLSPNGCMDAAENKNPFALICAGVSLRRAQDWLRYGAIAPAQFERLYGCSRKQEIRSD